MINTIKVNQDITLVERRGAEGRYKVENYTEILDVFREFIKLHPEAKRFDDTSSFDPSPWNSLHARAFLHVKNEQVLALLVLWEQQLQWLIAKESEPPTAA